MYKFSGICVLVVVVVLQQMVAATRADDSLDTNGLRIALKMYNECSKTEGGFSPCLKKKALTLLDRVGRLDKIFVTDSITVVRAPQAKNLIEPEPLTEEQLETSLPRGADAQDAALTTILFDRLSKLISSRSLQVTFPKIYPSDLMLEEGRGKKMKGMMGGMMMGVAAKMAALIPIAIAGLFLLAGKALITAKIALLLSGIIALKKLFSGKNSGGGGHSFSSGGGGGFGSSGGGWDRRSLSDDAAAAATAQKLAYKAYNNPTTTTN